MPKSAQQLFSEGQASMTRILRGGSTGPHGDLKLRAGLKATDDDESDDDEVEETLVASFGKGHVARHDQAGQLDVFRQDKKSKGK